MLESIKIGVSAQNSISGESVQRLARGLNVNRHAGSRIPGKIDIIIMLIRLSPLLLAAASAEE